jgi:hypothetical protein
MIFRIWRGITCLMRIGFGAMLTRRRTVAS